jgi:hypothetical protein
MSHGHIIGTNQVIPDRLFLTALIEITLQQSAQQLDPVHSYQGFDLPNSHLSSASLHEITQQAHKLLNRTRVVLYGDAPATL